MKVWFQNRRMKHKRQTLGKEDGDEKDGVPSNEIGNHKDEKLLIDDDDKKSFHSGDVSGDPGGSLSDRTDRNSIRAGNNNNSPSAANNNSSQSNTGFNNNSNGASSSGSNNSVSSSFENMIADDDSRSHDENEVISPIVHPNKVIKESRIKSEGGLKTPEIIKHHIAGKKKSTSSSAQEVCTITSKGVLLAMPDSTVNNSTLPGNSASRSLTPSTTPEAPGHLNLRSPLTIQPTHSEHLSRPRSSPSSTNTPLLSFGHSFLNISSGTPEAGKSVAGTSQSPIQTLQNIYHHTKTMDFRNGFSNNRQKNSSIYSQNQSQNLHRPEDCIQLRDSYSDEAHTLYARQHQTTISRIGQHGKSNTTLQNIYSATVPYHQQQSPYLHTQEYHGYGSSQLTHHCTYNRNMQDGNAFDTGQGYSHIHNDQSADGYMTNVNYGYSIRRTYHPTGENFSLHGHSTVPLQSEQHYYSDNQQNTQQGQHLVSSYVGHRMPIHSNQKEYRAEVKCQSDNYYEQRTEQLLHDGGDLVNISNNYASSPDAFTTVGITTTATAIAAANAVVITPPDSTGQVENYSDSYVNLYGNPVSATVPTQSVDNSNSSSDFNFLSNLANDFAPEYYQLS